MIDYRIQTFLVLYETMNYRQTAQLLRMSQPAVTQQIHALEREYGCTLFYYDGRRLHRTPQADRLEEYARAAVYNDQRLRMELARPQIRPVRLGVTRTIGDFVIPQKLCHFLARPDRTVELTVDNTQTLLGLLESERLDLTLVEGMFDKNRYDCRLYRESPFIGVCRRDHPFAGRTVSPDALRGQSVLLREPGSGTRAIFENALRGAGMTVRDLGRVICVNSFSVILQLLRADIGITFAYQEICAGIPELCAFSLEGMLRNGSFYFVYPKGADPSDLIAAQPGEEGGGQ